MNRKLVVTLALISSMATILLTSGVQAEPVRSQDTSARLGYVQRLLTESSAARKVEQSGSAQAREMKAQAQAHYDKAVALYDAGDREAAEAELAESIRLLTAASGVVPCRRARWQSGSTVRS